MLVLIPVFWTLFTFGLVGNIKDGFDGTQLRNSSSSEQVPMTGKPMKIPPKKV